jgi:succinate-semialdehyde dehydrogenase/glutarate-semialdehyde dehydrogenase
MADEQPMPPSRRSNSDDITLDRGHYIDGADTTSDSDAVSTATSPATGDTLGTVPDGTRTDVRRAIDAAAAADAFGSRSRFERAEILHDVADAIDDQAERLAAWLTADQGKPLAEALGEIESCATKFRASAEDIRRDELPTLPSQDPHKQIHLRREPHGVYGVITPWNYPVSTATTYLAPGLAAGNTVVWVPAPETSLVTLEFASVVGECLPDGVLNLVTGDGPVVGDELVVNDSVDAVAFTGSSAVGEQIADRSGTKPTLLELGGNGPVIVMADADIERAVERTAAGCFTNAGQICTASERILVHESLVEEFTDRLTTHAEEISVGDPTVEDVDMGPLNNQGVAEKMDRHIADAVEAGATLTTGGDRRSGMPTDLYYDPTVLSGVDSEMTVSREETFGPIAPIESVTSATEALERANDSDFGLSVGVFTESITTAEEFIDGLEAGAVNINDASSYWESHTPVGGYTGKRSGVGRYGGRFTIDEMSQLKTVTVDSR